MSFLALVLVKDMVAGILNTFANQMQIGDIVLTRKPHVQRLVLIGQDDRASTNSTALRIVNFLTA